MEAGQGHWFRTATAASEMSKFCYTTRGETFTDKPYTHYDMGFVSTGKFRKFD